ncbi:MAG: hypothetical protein IH946_06590 [Bacteroidetes bacterium]|nr:hypothetical protein [Bacteroidota bacterium]
MKQQSDKFDDIFREAFRNADAGVQDDIWEMIDPTLDNLNQNLQPKPFYYIRLMAVASIVLFASLGLYFWQFQPGELMVNEAVLADNSETGSQDITNQNVANAEQAGIVNNIPQVFPSGSKENKEGSNSIGSASTSTVKNNITAVDPVIQIVDNSIPKGQKSKKIIPPPVVLPKGTEANPILADGAMDLSSTDVDYVEPEVPTSAEPAADIPAEPASSLMRENMIADNSPTELSKIQVIDPPVVDPPIKEGGMKMWVSSILSPDYSNQFFSAASGGTLLHAFGPANVDENARLEEYKDASKAKMGMTGGMIFGLEFSDHWSFQTGFLMANKGEKTREKINSLSTKKTTYGFGSGNNGITTEIVTTGKPTVAEDNIFSAAGTSPASRYGNNANFLVAHPGVTGDNFSLSEDELFEERDLVREVDYQYHYYDIPFVVQYRTSTKKFTYFTSTGFSANIFKRNKIITEEAYSGDITESVGKEFPFRNVSYSFLLSVGVEYKFMKKVGISLEPTFRHSIISISRKSYIQGFPYSFGLVGGIRYHIN